MFLPFWGEEREVVRKLKSSVRRGALRRTRALRIAKMIRIDVGVKLVVERRFCGSWKIGSSVPFRAEVGMNLLQIREICWRIATRVPMVKYSDDADSIRDLRSTLGSDDNGTSFLCAARR